MLFPSNHRGLATAQHRFLPNLHSFPSPRSPPCLPPPHPSSSRRCRSRFHSLFRTPASLRRRRTASWVPCRLSLPRRCWRTTKSRCPPTLRVHPSVRCTPSFSRSSLGPRCRHSRCTCPRTRRCRAPPSSSRRCTCRPLQHPALLLHKGTARALRTCSSRFHICTRRRHNSRREWPCSRRYSSCSNTNSIRHHKARRSLSQQVRRPNKTI